MINRDYLTPRECGEKIGMTADYIRREVRDGLLKAEIVERPVRPGRSQSRPRVRIYHDDFKAYVKRYWRRFFEQLFPPAA